MNDLISRSWLLDVVENAIQWDTERDRNLAIHHVRELTPSAQQEPQWIPCSEGMPDAKGEYLVVFHPCYWDNVEPGVKVGIDSFRGKTTWAKKKYQRVIAWMPLPEPWKGDQE